MTRLLLVLLLAGAGAWFTYWRLERIGSRAWVAALARAIAWSALGLLLLDLTCADRSGLVSRPLVMLDASLSMTAAGGHWAEARDSAAAWGEVQRFGDPGGGSDTLARFGRSELGGALRAAAVSDRKVIVVSDGEIDDAQDLPAEALTRVSVRLFPRDSAPDLALIRVDGPDRVTSGDTVRLVATVRAYHAPADSVRLTVRLDDRILVRRSVRLGAEGSASVPLAFAATGISGDVVLRVGLADSLDREPRDDARLWLLRVTPTPGVVVLASPADWDARFLLNSLREVADLPVRGYERVEPGRWRAMETLQSASAEEVLQAARRADVLVAKGGAAEMVRASRARGMWRWPSGEGGETLIPGEWYAAAATNSPIAGALLGLPVDSFPPLLQVTPIEPGSGDWVGLTAQLGRRGAERPIFTGRITAGRREVMTAADGLWHWRFRGGSSEQAYRSLVAGTLAWLLSAGDSATGRARPVRPVVANARPLLFEWTGGGAPAPLPITVRGDSLTRSDTLRFDGAGRAELRLPPGRYRYSLQGGGGGVVVVDRWSEEWLPRGRALEGRESAAIASTGVTSTRRWIWLFFLVIAGLTAEWFARRRLGLR